MKWMKKVWNNLRLQWTVARIKARFHVRNMMAFFKRDKSEDADIESAFQTIFTNFETALGEMFRDLDGYEPAPGSA